MAAAKKQAVQVRLKESSEVKSRRGQVREKKMVKRFREKSCSKAALVKRDTLFPNIYWWYFERSDVRKIALSSWQNNPLTVSKRREDFVPTQAKSLSMCANYFENIPLCLFLIHESHTQIHNVYAHVHVHTYADTHTQYTYSSVAARSLQVLINHPAVIPS